MKRLSKKLETLILMGVRDAGSYDPDEALIRYEEQMTCQESDVARGFLSWVNEDREKRGFGYNIRERFSEYCRLTT